MSQDKLALKNAFAKIKAICDVSEGRSQLFPFGGTGYKASVSHYFESSTEIANFAVQPGSEKDLQLILNAIAETRVSFGIKCGGHATNPGFSSTKGVQIFLTRLNKINVRTEGERTVVDVGAGCLFMEVYRELDSRKLGVVGASGLAGVGVSGWLLGGGYSVKTGEYGLGVDNIESARVVLPGHSDPIKVSATENKDLFFAIKGGVNNFGIVTEFTLKTHPQKNYYDFQLGYKEEHYDEAKSAVAKFTEQTDGKANLEATFNCNNTPEGLQNSLSVHCTYDGVWPTVSPFKELRATADSVVNFGDPLPPNKVFPFGSQDAEPPAPPATSSFYLADTLRSFANGTYDLGELPGDLVGDETDEAQLSILMTGQLLQINEFLGDGSLRTPSSDLVSKLKSLSISPRPMPGIGQYPRGSWGNVVVDKFTPEIIHIIQAEFNALAKHIEERKGRRVSIGLWPFPETMFDNATDSAWPHKKSHPNLPIIVYLVWQDKKDDDFWIGELKATLQSLRDKIYPLRPASKDLPYFLNTALAGATSAHDLWRGNLERLKVLKKTYDPKGVMCLTGGFKIHHIVGANGECGCNQRAVGA